MAIKLLLVDDQPSVRRGLRMSLALEEDFWIGGEAGSGTEALAQVKEISPDVVIMDVEMPAMDGIAATQALRESAPGVVVVVLSLYDDAAVRERAARAGAFAFVAKHAPPDELIAAIRQAAERK